MTNSYPSFAAASRLRFYMTSWLWSCPPSPQHNVLHNVTKPSRLTSALLVPIEPHSGPSLHAHLMVPTTIPHHLSLLQTKHKTHLFNSYLGPLFCSRQLQQTKCTLSPSDHRASPFEQRECRAKELCFNYDEAWSSTHTCKRPVMAILECPSTPTTAILEFHDCFPTLDDSVDDDPTPFPLHAITNTTVGEMMLLRGSINNFPINIFINCGAATNFLNPRIAYRLGLPNSTTSNLQFTAASGQAMAPSSEVHNVTIIIGNYHFTNSFLLLPVAGCDLVLGAQWLDMLGFIG